MALFNQDFIRAADEVLSPVVMFISSNDGRCNIDMLFGRDVMINANSMKSLGQYTQEEVDRIKMLQSS